MIYLFYGSDTAKIRAKAFAWVAAARAKAPDAAYIRLDQDTLTEQSLMEALGTQGLFFSKSLILLDEPFATSDTADLVLENLKLLADSANPVAIVAPKLIPARAKKVEAKAEKVFKLDTVEKAKAGFNNDLVNALSAKDGAALWKELQKAQRKEDVPEMLHGLLHWKARQMMEKGGRGWSSREARKLSRNLIELLADSRRGDLPLKDALERFALSLG